MVRLAELDLELQQRVVAMDRLAAREAIKALDQLPPPRERSKLPEKEFQNKTVIPIAEMLGWFVYHPFLSKFSMRGWPDLSLLRASTRSIRFAELKSDDRTLTEDQARVIVMLRAAGMIVDIWRPWTGDQAILDALR